MANNNDISTAYLRELTATNQCDFTFSLRVPSDAFGVEINEEIHAIRKLTDTTGSLLQHTRNKIIRLLKDAGAGNQCDDSSVIPMSLKYSGNKKTCHNKTVLTQFFSRGESLLFKIFNQQYFVIINAPLIKTLELPEVIYANFITQPMKLKASHMVHEMSAFHWYKSLDKISWKSVGNRFQYSVSEEDTNHYLKLVVVPINLHSKGPSAEVISKSVVERVAEIPYCPFEARHEFTKEPLRNNDYRIISYNILSSRYSETNEQFPYCSPKALAIDYRKQVIMKELLGYNGDIICLQEVDQRHYTEYFMEQFKNNGYASIFHKKGNRIPEGLACVFNKSRLKHIKTQQIVLSMEIQRNKLFSQQWDFLKKNEDIKNQFLKQATSLQVTFLKAKERNTEIVVANTHLFYHPDATMIRLIQVNMVTTFLNFLRNRELKSGRDLAVIICGDFNSSPTSPITEYMIDGRVDPKHHEIFGGTKPERILFHSMCFKSACGFPKYTNYTSSFKECLDYVFIERSRFAVKRVIPMPSEEELLAYEGLPNEVYPSDHISLVVDVQLL